MEQRWFSVNQIRKQQRVRRERGVRAMMNGELPYEQRGRIRYARACDIEAWEESRLTRTFPPSRFPIRPELLDLRG